MQLHHVTMSGLLSNKKLNVMFVKLLINSFSESMLENVR